jgi:chromosome segregation ATPase
MNIHDIDTAKSNLNQALNLFSPMVTALSGAEEVLSILSNAVKHKDVLTKEVDALKKSVADLQAKEEASKVAITENDAATAAAKAEAVQAIADAKQQADAKVAEILASVAAQTKVAVEAFGKKQADLTAKIDELDKDLASKVVQAQIREAELSTAVQQLEAKLEKIKGQAKKFADTLVG